ncbi:MAG: coenzyme F420-0:L-glutamate ligase, partial [Promethearchaeota archaeon]
MKNKIEILKLENFPLINEGDDIAEIILNSLKENNISLQNGDIILIAQSIISKSLGLIRNLSEIEVTENAKELHKKVTSKAKPMGLPERSPELIQMILNESKEIVKSEHVLITETYHGFICANAGIDKSNVEGKNMVSLLPSEPDIEAKKIQEKIEGELKRNIALIITDSFGRPFRNGAVGVAIGISGISAILDKRGCSDLFGNKLQSTIVAQIDNLASAAQLVMGEANEGIPVAIIRGYEYERRENSDIKDIIRTKDSDLFRNSNLKYFEEILKKRTSYKKQFSNKEINKEIIFDCLKLAILAPNAHNSQPWKFVIL